MDFRAIFKNIKEILIKRARVKENDKFNYQKQQIQFFVLFCFADKPQISCLSNQKLLFWGIKVLL